MASEELREPSVPVPRKGEVALGTVAPRLRIMCKELGGRPTATQRQVSASRGAGEAHSALNLLPLQGAAHSPGRGGSVKGSWGAVICQLSAGEGSFSPSAGGN